MDCLEIDRLAPPSIVEILLVAAALSWVGPSVAHAQRADSASKPGPDSASNPGAAAQAGVARAQARPGQPQANRPQASQPQASQPGSLLYRIWADRSESPDFADDPGSRVALRQYIRGRLALVGDTVEFHAEMDVLAGQLVGDPNPRVPADVQSGTRPTNQPWSGGQVVNPRQFYATWRSPVGELRGGLQTSQWGLGILANSGATDTEGLFGQHFGGDRVVRARFATAPLRAAFDSGFAHDFYLAVGADFVWRDENADLLAGDRAVEGLVAALYDTEPTKAGAYVVYRDQNDRDDDFLKVWAFDLYADHRADIGDDVEVRAAAEAALLTGQSDRTLNRQAGAIDLKQLGAAAELGARFKPADLGLKLRAGYASGDANVDDDTLYRFRFDPNYNVGLVLFNHYLPAVTRTGARSIHDPSRTARAPKGVDGLVSDGGIENALYLSPRLTYGHQDGFLAGLSLLWAQSAQPLYDSYASFENGGAVTGINGRRPASDDLGLEVDAAVRYRFRPVDALTLEAKVEYGLLFPGQAFADQAGNLADPQSLARMRLAAMW